jgi:hypothetical protein
VTSSQSLLLLAALLGAGAALSQARAAPLDADTCSKLTVEHERLETAGVDQTMAKGPEWGKANLAPEKIEEVRRFIELEELIQFRCRSKARVTLPPDPEDKVKEKDQGKEKDQAKDGADKGAPSKDTAGPSKAKAPEPATKAKADATVQPKTLPKKQDSAPKAKSAAQQPPKKPPPKAKAEEDPEEDGNPFGKPFDNPPQ